MVFSPWVRNPSLPKRYTGLSCKSIRSSLNCQKNGRKDTAYLNYEFKSPGCNIQRFDPKAFLSMMRNKVFLGVGDSFNPNLQHSVRCLVESVAATKDVNGALFKTGLSAQGYVVPQYNATFLTIASSFLVDATPVGSVSSSSPWKVNLDVPSKEWTPFLRHSHYVVFSAGHWFTNSGNLRQWFVKKQQQKGMTSSAAMTAAYTTMRNYIASSGYTGLPMVLTYTASHYESAFAATDSVKACSGAKGPMTSKQMAFASKKSDALEGRTAVVKLSAQPLGEALHGWVRNPFVKRYTGYSCQSIRSQLNCDRNGRPDSEYLNYEWKAPGCSIKRFNTAAFLRTVRNRVFMSAGDSYATNLYHALRCLIETTTKVQDYSTSSAFGTGVKASGFSVPSHNFLFLRQSTNFLVDSEPQGSASSKGVWTVRLWQADPKWAKLIPHVNYVLFATGHWFTNAPSNTRDYRDNNGKQISINSMRAMRTAIRTVRQTIQSTNFRGMPLFLSYTATHYQKSFPPQDSMNDCMGAKSPVGNNVVAYAEKNTFFMQARNQLRSLSRRSTFPFRLLFCRSHLTVPSHRPVFPPPLSVSLSRSHRTVRSHHPVVPSPLSVSPCPSIFPPPVSVPPCRPVDPSPLAIPLLVPSNRLLLPSALPSLFPCTISIPSSRLRFAPPVGVPYCRPLLPSLIAVTYCHLPFPIAVPSPLTLLACRPFVPSCRSLLPAPLAPPLNPDVFLDSIVSIGPPLTFPLPESHRARWIYTPRLAPQYTAESCKSLGRNFACQRNGRPDSEYEKYTWRSFGCTIAE
ncbi:unnamed protein product [Closterium sp. NIES-64]|nr:unnamed protein product [Closterium sp. NIES-64]